MPRVSPAGSGVGRRRFKNVLPRDKNQAQADTPTFTMQADQSVNRVPSIGSMRNVLAIAPPTAPAVFTPYRIATARRFSSSGAVTAATAAGSVPPMSKVGIRRITAESSNRIVVAPNTPRAICPPQAI